MSSIEALREESTPASEEVSPPLVHVDGTWRLASDFAPTDTLNKLLVALSPVTSGKMCDNAAVHPIASCPMLHSLDQKVLVGTELIRLRTLEQDSAAFRYLLSHPEHRGLPCGNKKQHPARGCKFVHLLPNVTVQREKIPVAELLENSAVEHLKKFPFHQGRWCTSKIDHDAVTCPFVHWKDNTPKRPPPKQRPDEASPKRQGPSPTDLSQKETSLSRAEAEEDILLAKHVEQFEARSGTKKPNSDETSTPSPRLGTAEQREKPVKAGTVLTAADILPRSTFARVLAGLIALVIAWLFAS